MPGPEQVVGVELLTEFVASFAFIAAVVASKGNPIVAGIALAIAIFLGGWMGDRANHVNPAITIGLLVNGQVGFARGASLIAMQVIGGILAVVAVALSKKMNFKKL
jgi:glycerol uptake facilitator-like aquaporin